MLLKMTMMFKKYIITLQISNDRLKKSVIMADFLTHKVVMSALFITNSDIFHHHQLKISDIGTRYHSLWTIDIHK